MNYIMISPFFPKNFQLFARRLKERGVNVLGIGTEAYDNLGSDLQNNLTEYYKVENLEDYGEVAKAVAFFYSKYGKIHRIESHNEHWLELDAFLREEFNIPGLRTKDLQNVKHKSKMKNLFKKIGAPIVDGRVVKTHRQLDNALIKLGYPVVAKPDVGVGAAATYRLNDYLDVRSFKEEWDLEVPYFIEKFVEDGVLCTYDGLIDGNGEIVFETSFDYGFPTLDIQEKRRDYHYFVQKEIDPKLRELGRKIVKAFKHEERFFHIEFFRLADGSYITLEYNGRLAGGYTIDVYNYAHGIDLYDEYASIVQGGDFKGSEEEPQYGVAICRLDSEKYRYSIDDLKDKYGSNFKMTEPTPEAFRDLLGDTFIIITTATRDDVQKIVDYVLTKTD